MSKAHYDKIKLFVQTITDLVASNGLAAELQPDVRRLPGLLIYERRVGGIKRHLWIAPVRDPSPPWCEFSMAWFTEVEGGLPAEGHWVGNLENTIEAFRRFLIEGEEWRSWHRHITLIYAKQSSMTAKETTIPPADQSKLEALRVYFGRKFPGHIIIDHHENETITEDFIIKSPSSDRNYKCNVCRRFLDDNSADAIVSKMEHWKVAEYLERNSPVVVNSGGKHADKSIGVL